MGKTKKKPDSDKTFKSDQQVVYDCKFYEATHPQEIGIWNLAVAAYYHIEGTDVDDALSAIE